MAQVPLRDRVVAITGAGRGLGFGIARALSAQGAAIALLDRNAERVRLAAASLSNEGLALTCDMASLNQVMAAQTQALAHFGQIDVWINNAGLALTGQSFAQLKAPDFAAMVDSNLIGTFNGCKAAMAAMTGRGGAIYNMFGAGSDGNPVAGMIGYGTTKRAVQFLTAALAEELEGSNVLVAGISPGLVITEGFLREHTKVAAKERSAREAVVNLIGDEVGTIADWIADIVTENCENGRVFQWLTDEKINRRRSQPDRQLLSRFI